MVTLRQKTLIWLSLISIISSSCLEVNSIRKDAERVKGKKINVLQILFLSRNENKYCNKVLLYFLIPLQKDSLNIS